MHVFLSVLYYNTSREACTLVDLLTHCYAFHDILKPGFPRNFRQDGHTMRVPLHEQRVLLNLPTIRRCQCSSVHGGMPFSLNSRYIKHGDLAISIGDNQRAILSGHRAYVVVFHHANTFRLNVRLLPNATDRSTCMEGPHGKLCARLPDGLGGNDPNSFPYIHQFPG